MEGSGVQIQPGAITEQDPALKIKMRPSNMAQKVKALAAKHDNPNLMPGTHMTEGQIPESCPPTICTRHPKVNK